MYTYRASSIYNCKRKLSALRLGIPPEPPPAWLETMAEEGNLHEKAVKDKLWKEEWAIHGEQEDLLLRNDSLPFQVTGHIDGKATKLDKEWLLEIKSMSEYETQRWVREGWEGFPTYANQLTLYWAMTGATRALYIVKNRSSGFIERNFLEVPPRDITAVLSHIQKVEDHCSKVSWPMVSTYDENSIESKRCPWVKILGCILSPSFKAQDIEDLIDAEWHYLKGKELEKWGKALVSASKGCFEEHSIAQGLKGQTWEFGKLRIKHQHVERRGYDVQGTEYDETRITVKKEKE